MSQLREKCAGTVKAKEGEEELLEKFWAANHYFAGSYDKQEDFEHFNEEMVAVEKSVANRLFYLALPPSVFKPVTSMLKVRSMFSCRNQFPFQLTSFLLAFNKSHSNRGGQD